MLPSQAPGQATASLPLQKLQPIGNIMTSGFENSIPIGSSALPINNLLYLLNQQTTPIGNSPGKPNLRG